MPTVTPPGTRTRTRTRTVPVLLASSAYTTENIFYTALVLFLTLFNILFFLFPFLPSKKQGSVSELSRAVRAPQKRETEHIPWPYRHPGIHASWNPRFLPAGTTVQKIPSRQGKPSPKIGSTHLHTTPLILPCPPCNPLFTIQKRFDLQAAHRTLRYPGLVCLQPSMAKKNCYDASWRFYMDWVIC